MKLYLPRTCFMITAGQTLENIRKTMGEREGGAASPWFNCIINKICSNDTSELCFENLKNSAERQNLLEILTLASWVSKQLWHREKDGVVALHPHQSESATGHVQTLSRPEMSQLTQTWTNMALKAWQIPLGTLVMLASTSAESVGSQLRPKSTDDKPASSSLCCL